MLQKVKEFIRQDQQYFSVCKGNKDARNTRMLRKGSIVYAFVLCFYTILTVLTKQPQVLQTMYYVFDVIHFCLCIMILAYLFKTPAARLNDLYISIATFISANVEYVLVAQMRHSEGTALVKYEKLSQTDQLTGLYNKVAIENIV